MNGISRTFFAASESLLRLLAWFPFITAERINALADWCGRRAAAPAERPS